MALNTTTSGEAELTHATRSGPALQVSEITESNMQNPTLERVFSIIGHGFSQVLLTKEISEK